MKTNSIQSTTCTPETSEKSIKIGIATTPEEKKEIYHFRYQIYVEEMSKQLITVDHANKLIQDELDEWTYLLDARIDSELIATARINIGPLEKFPQEVVDLLAMDTFQVSGIEQADSNFAFITKLMVTPAHRGSPALYLLIAKCYELCCNNQVQFAFGVCNFDLLRLYEQIGLQRYSRNFIYPGYGLATPIVLLIDDIQHLRTVRSPLFRLARKRETVNTQVVEWFHAKFTENSPIINSQLVSEEDLWSVLCKRLNSSPLEAIALLHELSLAEAKKFLHSCGSMVLCDAGDIVISQGDASYAYNVLISGRLRSLTFQRPVKNYTSPGQHFGANGLTEHINHTEDIVAVNSVEILVLSGLAFQRFANSHPEIAHKLMRKTRTTKRKINNF